MSTPPPPQNYGDDNNDPDLPPPPGPSHDQLLREWISKRLQLTNQYAHLPGLHGGFMFPQGTEAVTGNPINQYYPYLGGQHMAPQVNIAMPTNIQHSAEFIRLRQSLLQAQGRSLPGLQAPAPPAPAVRASYHSLAHTHANQTPNQDQEHGIHNENADEDTVKSQPDLGNALQEALNKKINQKIQEKLKKLKPNVTAMAHLLQEQKTQTTQQALPQPQHGNLAQQQRMMLHSLSRLDHRVGGDDGAARDAYGTQAIQLPAQHVEHSATNNASTQSQDFLHDDAIAGIANNTTKVRKQAPKESIAEIKAGPAYEVDDPYIGTASPLKASRANAKKRRKGSRKLEEKGTTVSAQLDIIIDSIKSDNVRSALQEDRENIRAKRKERQQTQEGQLRDMESRLQMYTELEGLAGEIYNVRSETEGNTKNSRAATSKHEGALDMIHLGLKNYRMLEDKADHILQIDEKK